MRNVAQVVAETLGRLGVDAVFGVVGSGNFVLTEALRGAGARFVAARHEGGAVSMADGWTRTAGRVGVASVHQGPGLTNAVTALAEAAKGRTPLLVLAAEAPASAINSTFRIDQGALVVSADAIVERVHGPVTAVVDATRALRRASVERRPVVMMLPTDIGAQECAASEPPPEAPPLATPHPPAEAIAAVADILAAAERPAVVAGRGAVLAAARGTLVELGERLGAVLASSALAHGLFAGEPLDLGILGGFSSPVAARLLGRADVVIVFGSALTRWTTRNGNLFGSGATVVQVDIDPVAIGRQHPVDLGLVGDAAGAAGALVAELDRRGLRVRGWRGEELAAQIRRESWRNQPYEPAAANGHIDPRELSIRLEDRLPAERTLVLDSGHFMGYPAMYLSVPDPEGFVFTQGFQAIGLGLPSAIGAAIARPDRLCVAALGDCGALMALPELETVARLRLPMLLVVYNDAAAGAEVHHFGPLGHPLHIVRFPETDFAALARAAGAEGITVRAPEDLAPVSSWLERRDGPLLVDAKVDPAVRADWLDDAFAGA